MKKICAFFIVCIVCLNEFGAMAANVNVKKASSVKKQETSGLESITSGSLLPNVIGLVSNVSALKKQSDELKAECVPTSTEISWVNKMVQEYAKTGAKTAEDMNGKNSCNEDYVQSVQNARAGGVGDPCVPVFSAVDNIWDQYPEVRVAKYCPDLSDLQCSESKKKTESNIYTVFGQLDFSAEDYTADEADMYAKMVEKAEKCAPEKINARTRESYASFVKQTISGVGQNTNTGTVYDAIGSLTQSGSGLSGISSLAPTVVQFLDK